MLLPWLFRGTALRRRRRVFHVGQCGTVWRNYSHWPAATGRVGDFIAMGATFSMRRPSSCRELLVRRGFIPLLHSWFALRLVVVCSGLATRWFTNLVHQNYRKRDYFPLWSLVAAARRRSYGPKTTNLLFVYHRLIILVRSSTCWVASDHGV